MDSLSPVETKKEMENEEKQTYIEEAQHGEDGRKLPGGNMSDHDRKAMTRKILLKTDLRVIPIMALLFLCSFLDRTNVGNAKLIGLEANLHISDHQYDIGLTIYYLTYILSEIPSNLVLKKVSPKIWLPLLTAAWGIVTMCLGFVQNYAGFVVVRAILGMTEGGLLPGIVLYLSGMYTRSEMALRIGLFYTSASLSGAFGGLLARGLNAIGTAGGLTGWRWIFIVEGLFTVVSAVLAYFALPNGLATAKYLTEEERVFATTRLQLDKPMRPTVDGVQYEETDHEKFQWSEVIRGLLSLSTWLSALAYFGILAGLYSFGLFLPTIISELGVTTNANDAQLYSVPPYAVAAVLTVVVSIISDRLKLRGVIMLCVLPIAIIGYAVIATVPVTSSHVKYGMTFMMATGMYASVPCVLVWNSNNSAGHYKRATTTALQLAIANSGGFVATFIYPAADGPQYHRGHFVILGLLVAAWFLVLANVMWCWKKNKDKAAGKYAQFEGCGDDRDPIFRNVL